MPIWLRKYTYKQIEEYYIRAKEASEKPTEPSPKSKDIFGPNISPSYSTKASK